MLQKLRSIKPKTARIDTAALLVIASLGALISPQVAQARSWSCVGWGTFDIPKVNIAGAYWCGGPRGSDLNITSVYGEFYPVVPLNNLCNTRMRVEFFNTYGDKTHTFFSPLRRGFEYDGWYASN
jgi:hypothetical protein